MTKKHYEAIASILRKNIDWDNSDMSADIAQNLADYFAQDNPRFDRARFLQACGITALDTCWCGSRSVHTHE